MPCGGVLRKLTRKKQLTFDPLITPLRRCLGIFDLSMAGIGNMVGAGVFILTGVIAREKAGPGVVLSYLLAGVAMCLASLSYAEYGARIPKAGSAYTYTYITLGEIWAFIVGWDVILERMLTAAAVARGWSSMLDSLLGGVIRNSTLSSIGELHVPGISAYPDFVAFSVTLLGVILVSVGVKVVSVTNNFMSVLNLVSLYVIIGLGFWKADWDNWSGEAQGGFLPYGFKGVIAGAATLFYSFVGFESITNAGEEATDPASQIPLATFITMLFVTVTYMCASAALTLMVPFYEINIDAPFPEAFRTLGITWAVYVVSIGALLGITTSLIMDHYGMPRTVYAMASDGLLFKCLAWVHPLTQTPMAATLTFGTITAVLAFLFDYSVLVEFLSIGTLTCFSVVSACVIVNRYQEPDHVPLLSQTDFTLDADDEPAYTSTAVEEIVRRELYSGETPLLRKEFKNNKFFANVPGNVVIYLAILLLAGCAVILGLLLRFSDTYDIYGDDQIWMLTVLFLAFIGISIGIFMIEVYQETNEPSGFAVPLVPYIPAASIIINVGLLVQLPVTAWYRYVIWLVTGLLIYFCYGIRHSVETRPLAESAANIVSYSALTNTVETSH